MKNNKLTRREFIKSGTLAATGTIILQNPIRLLASQAEKSRVILIRHKNVIDKNGNLNALILENMLDEAMINLFNTETAEKAWQQIIKPKDIVGIKTNVYNYLRTPIELENAIRKYVLMSGVREENISINDRGVLRDPVFKRATVLINSRPMRTHYWSGVGSLIKNYIMFVDNPSSYHGDSCADLASIWNLPHVKGKTKLNVLVMLSPLFHSVGPHGFSEEYLWQYKGLIIGSDPVACDTIGLKIIEAKRKEYFGETKPLSPPAKHITLADTRHHLGNASIERIELIKMGWEEDILI